MNKTDIDNALDELSRSIASADDPELIRDFLKSILTPTEISEVTARWALVKAIYDGKSQRKISEELGLSLCKITRGSKELKKENSSFKIMIEKWKKMSGQ